MATDEIKNMEKTNVDTVHDDVGSDTQHRCGWNKCTPRCLQKLHNVYLLCTTMCVIVTIQGNLVNTYPDIFKLENVNPYPAFNLKVNLFSPT